MNRLNFAIGARPLGEMEMLRVDPRILNFADGWTVEYTYNGEKVTIPGSFKGVLYPFQYAEIYKTDESEENPGEAESEKALYLGLGWPSCDFEVIIALRIAGADVLDPEGKVTYEVVKFGGAPDMVVRRNGQFITDFTQYGLWGRFFKMEKALVTGILS